MNNDSAWVLIKKKVNVSDAFQAGELRQFFDDGLTCVDNGTYLAACLSFLAGIEMSLRLPLLFLHGKDIRTSYESKKDVPLLSNNLLRIASDTLGLPIELLRYEDEEMIQFHSNLKLDDYKNKVRIVKVRNNVCHGNLFNFVTESPEKSEYFKEGDEKGPGYFLGDIEREARKLEVIVLKWAAGYKVWWENYEKHHAKID